MDKTNELITANNKYYNKICDKYGSLTTNDNISRDLTTDIIFIPHDKCVGKHIDLGKARGKCDSKTGIIYIRENVYCDHLLVHEYIHRLSRNYKHTGYLKKQWIEGFCYPYRKNEGILYWGINEVFTEWVAYDITGIKEDNPYQLYFGIMQHIVEKLGQNKYQKLIHAYFNGDKIVLCEMIYEVYGNETKNLLNEISLRLDKLIYKSK